MFVGSAIPRQNFALTFHPNRHHGQRNIDSLKGTKPLYDIIPDIHGQSSKLDALLEALSWRRTAAGWSNDAPARELIFLGDFIDRGPDNAAVLRTVRSLVDSGKAHAVMGNHELNAIHFHTPDGVTTGAYLRPHTEKNLHQHAAFLSEFPLGAPETEDAIAWMRSLPLVFETDHIRAVHACWAEESIAALRTVAPDTVLSEAQLVRAALKTDPLHAVVEVTTKGPEVDLPNGFSFRDKDGVERHEVRLQWWKHGAATWSELAMCVPDAGELPVTAPSAKVTDISYPMAAKPVFFGHYWLSGAPVLQAPNALCLDYSAGTDGPLVAYRIDDPTAPLHLDQIIGAAR